MKKKVCPLMVLACRDITMSMVRAWKIIMTPDEYFYDSETYPYQPVGYCALIQEMEDSPTLVVTAATSVTGSKNASGRSVLSLV